MKCHRPTLPTAVFAALISLQFNLVHAATFNYHGTLQDSGKPAEGSYDLELTLYTSASGGSAVAGPLVLYKVPVQHGSFSTSADFGPLANVAGTAWLGVQVRQAGSGDFAALSVRTPVTAEANASVCPGAWTLDGNAGTLPGTGLGQNYLGTADNQPLVFAVNGIQAGELTPPLGSGYPDSVNVVFGSMGNHLGASSAGSTVGGGGANSSACGSTLDQPCVNAAISAFSTVAGGRGNQTIGTDASVGGGNSNQTNGNYATIAGGVFNVANADSATIGGGISNQVSTEGATIAGGVYGVASGAYAGILSGEQNHASGYESVVIGGFGNQATAAYAVAAGDANVASAFAATVAGGSDNEASGINSTVAGGNFNLAAGDNSFAAGNGARVSAPVGSCNPGFCGDYGTFVWSDGSTSTFNSSGPQQFLIQAVGGVGINTTPVNSSVELTIAAEPNNSDYASIYLRQSAINAGMLISSGAATSSAANNAVFSIDQYNGTTQTHVMRIDAAGNTYNISGAWTMFSDRRLKRDIASIEHPLDTFLGLHGQTFEYIDPQQAMAQPGRRMGFIAQDVEKVLPQWVGEDERGYKMVTPTGFEALSVEALRELRAEKDAEIEVLQNRLDVLSERLSKLEAAKGR